jgi:POT family proton-dependent oligopeptide transporter
MANAIDSAHLEAESHPKGLYVLFATEMWERFSFYSMLALFTLYMQNGEQGFGWTAAEATNLYSWYLAAVYASPLIGGLIADKVTGYRKAVMIGGFFFMAGHLLLSFRSLLIVYLALGCLVVGNGFFKPNVSAMVGNLYKEGSHLKDRAYNIFYLGINIGAFLAPLVMEAVKSRFGYHPAFAVAAFGMLISVGILWKFKQHIEHADKWGKSTVLLENRAKLPIDDVPDWKRIGALVVIFAIVIVFWMAFHQNSSTITYWADDNTAWDVSGTISNAINPFWILVLTFPLVGFWKWLDSRGKEPSTPTKMAIGMCLTGLSFVILFLAARSGEAQTVTPDLYAKGSFRLNDRAAGNLVAAGAPQALVDKMMAAKADDKFIINDRKFDIDEKGSGEQKLTEALGKVLSPAEIQQHKAAIMQSSYQFQVSPVWLILAYMVLTLGELMLSPMGLALVSKVAPERWRGVMMGGWFLATAIGNKLTAIGVYWGIWKQSSFFIALAAMSFVMAIVLLLLLRPLKKAMPGI